MANGILNQVWPEWELEKQLGRGSYGSVYQAVRRDHNVESHAAIKIISIPSDEAELNALRSEGLDVNATKIYLNGIVNDFVNEIQLMQSLKGIQNIVSVEDYKVVEKTTSIGWDIYIRMELLTPFPNYSFNKKLTEDEVIKLGIDICTALEICGKRNIIHRDIKPENIFVNDFGDFKLGDFGIARKLENMTGGLSQKGTFNYMAPEVANSGMYDARVDIYSLGLVLYRLLNGNRLPFLESEQQLLSPNERRAAVDRRIRGEALPAPRDASPAMANLILCACAFDPNRRFPSAAEMKRALLAVRYGGAAQTVQSEWERTDPIPQEQPPVPDYDKTVSVRRAPGTAAPAGNGSARAGSPVPAWGGDPAPASPPKKRPKEKIPKEKGTKGKGKKIVLILLVAALLIGGGVFVFLMIKGGSTTIDGFYFLYDKYFDECDMDCYVQLCDGKWNMSSYANQFFEELSGTYKVSGDEITFHYDLDIWDSAYDEILQAVGGKSSGDVVLFTGTVKDGKLSLKGNAGTFYRDGVTDKKVDTSFPNGTYYYASGDSCSAEEYIRLYDGKWTSSDSESGTYKVDGNKITFKFDGEEYHAGTVKDGKLRLTKYRGYEWGAEVFYLNGVIK